MFAKNLARKKPQCSACSEGQALCAGAAQRDGSRSRGWGLRGGRRGDPSSDRKEEKKQKNSPEVQTVGTMAQIKQKDLKEVLKV